jgi:hypothetical protein
MAKKIIPIRYTSRDFASIKADLVEHAKRYYENSYKDFNEGSFGSLMLDSVAYVGDILSFYLDYQANESFLDTSTEFENVIKHGKQVGYKHASTNSTTGIATFYISIPANGLAPNLSYAPILKRGSTFATFNGAKFILNEDVRFDNPNNEIRVLKTDDNGAPITYAIKAKGLVVSGIIGFETVTIGDYERFKKVKLQQENIIEILSVFDAEGNEYYEVEYLSQNFIFKSVSNRNAEDTGLAKEVLKPFLVPRRFITEKSLVNTYLQFGASSDAVLTENDNGFSEPTRAVLDVYGKNYISGDFYDPTRILNSDKMGVAPSNTTLTVNYRYNDLSINTNAATNTLILISNPIFEFPERTNLSNALMNNVVNSLEVTNEAPLVGDMTIIDSDELKRRIHNTFATQARAVTENDYEALCYSMPSKYGTIKRVNVIKDNDSLKRNLNIFVLCEGIDGFLTRPNQTVKNNLKTWLNNSKMLNDTIDILDGKVVNYSIQFTAVGSNDRPKYDILTDAIAQLKTDLALLPDFGETFYITNIYNSLKKVDGLIDVVNVVLETKVGGLYSDVNFDVKANTSPDGRYVSVPLNVVMELKYPNDDIKGTIL